MRRSISMCNLTAVSSFMQRLYTCLEYIVVTHICPSVPDIILLHTRYIHKTIIIRVMRFRLILIMCQQRSAPPLRQFYRSIRIGFIAVRTTGKKICRHPIRFRQLRLLEFYIDLSGYGLISILHGRTSFADLYTLHPRPGYVS